jgi:Flp pilus assembly protein TadG
MIRPRRPCERGATAVEFAVVVWLFMILFLGIVQFALWWHAQHVVLGAAQDAARVAAAEDGTPAAGRARAVELLHAGLGQDARSAIVQARRDTRLAEVTVTARLRPVLPFGSGIRLHATGRSFAEHFRPAGSPP